MLLLALLFLGLEISGPPPVCGSMLLLRVRLKSSASGSDVLRDCLTGLDFLVDVSSVIRNGSRGRGEEKGNSGYMRPQTTASRIKNRIAQVTYLAGRAIIDHRDFVKSR